MLPDIYFEPWKNYKNPVVRQLAFAVASPNLIHMLPNDIQPSKKIDLHDSVEWQKFYQAYQSRLAKLDQDPAELVTFLAQIKSTRLGLRFEALLWFWLQDPENGFFQLLGHSIQSHKGGKTIGEIDFLVRNLANNEIEHWEVCLKYYLAEPDLNLTTWIGLNPEDTFFQKLSHLTHKQFQFTTALNYPIDARKAVIKGQLYLPHQHAQIPAWINTMRRLGRWQSEPPYYAKNVIRLSRLEWLCPNLCQPLFTSPHWWTNGLYYQMDQECFTMLRLKHVSNILLK